jgi:hypothetical protein
MDTSAIGKQSESLRDQSLRYCMRAAEEAGRCSVTLGRAGELSIRKRAATATFANFNFAKTYLELKRLRGDVERIEKSSRSRPTQAAVAARDTPKADHRIRSSLQS